MALIDTLVIIVSLTVIGVGSGLFDRSTANPRHTPSQPGPARAEMLGLASLVGHVTIYHRLSMWG
jgi:hypothetical protein